MENKPVSVVVPLVDMSPVNVVTYFLIGLGWIVHLKMKILKLDSRFFLFKKILVSRKSNVGLDSTTTTTTKLLQNILCCTLQKKESHIGLE